MFLQAKLLHFKKPIHHLKIHQTTITEPTVYLASDKGQKYDNLCYGGICVTQNSIIFEVSGYVPEANKGSSIRAEAYGATLTTSSYTLFKAYHNQDKKPIIHVMDNKGVIKCTKDHQWYLQFPAKPTASEFEIINKLYYQITFHYNVSFQHVKSHQKYQQNP